MDFTNDSPTLFDWISNSGTSTTIGSFGGGSGRKKSVPGVK